MDERSQHPLRRIVTWGASPQAQKIVPWKASDRICGKRLKATIPVLMAAIEKHGHLALDLQVRARRETISAATIDRTLAPARQGSGRRRSVSPLCQIMSPEFTVHRVENVGHAATLV